jgi:hypothetical protein
MFDAILNVAEIVQRCAAKPVARLGHPRLWLRRNCADAKLRQVRVEVLQSVRNAFRIVDEHESLHAQAFAVAESRLRGELKAALHDAMSSPEPRKRKLRVDTARQRAVLDGTSIDLGSEERARLLSVMLANEGAWLSGELKAFPRSNERPARLIKKMPPSITDLIDAKRGRGFRLDLSVGRLLRPGR